MKINQKNSNTMVNPKNNDKNVKMYIDGMILEDVNTFEYVGAIIKAGGSSDNELRIILVTATSVMIRPNVTWTSKNIRCKLDLYRSIVLFIFIYGCETWTLMLNEEDISN